MRTHRAAFSVDRLISRRFMAATILVGASLIPTFAAAQILPAVTRSNFVCAGNVASAFGCTSNDIAVASTVVTPDVSSCVDGEIVSLTVDLNLNQNGQTRYDPLVWLGENGNDPRQAVALGAGNLPVPNGNSCFVSSLPGSVQPDGNGFLDQESGADDCNDSAVSSSQPILQRIGPIPVRCRDSNNNGTLDLQGLITWQNNPDQSSCGDPGVDPLTPDPITGFRLDANATNPKCEYGLVETSVEVRNARLTVEKIYTPGGQGFSFSTVPALTPEGDPTAISSFVLTPPGTATQVFTLDVPPGGTGVQILEDTASLPAGITLASAVCTDSNNVDVGDPTVGITLNPGDQVTCTFTNDAMGAIALQKSAVPDMVSAAGQVVTYTFDVENIGPIALTGVGVTDPKPGLGPITCDGGATNGAITLNPGESIQCQADYTVTQPDIDLPAGQFTNTATATGTDDDGTVSVMDDATVSIDQVAALGIVKSLVSITGADLMTKGSVTADGDVLAYSVVVSNEGNTTLTGLNVSDPLIPGLDCGGVTTLPPAPAAGSSVTCTGTYTATQGDIDNNGGGDGDIDNLVTAQALFGSQSVGPESDSATAPITRNAIFTIAKTVDSVTGGQNGAVNSAGDVINYEVLITNTGNTTLTGLTVSDPLIPGLNCGGVTTLPPAPGPGNSVTCTGSYTVTQGDIDANGNPAASGQIQNTATADTAETEPQTDGANVPLTRDAVFTIAKSVASVTGGQNGAVDSAGDVINYEVLITNTGNTTLTGLTVTDPLIPGLSCGVTTLPPAPGPGNSVTCTGSYTVTQDDIDDNGNPAASGQIQNTATADTAETESQSDNANVPLTRDAVFTIEKSIASVTGGQNGAVNSAGDVINYEVLITNTGNTTLTGLTVSDPLIPGLNCGGVTTLPPAPGPGNSVTCTGSYTVTQGDIDANGNPAASGQIQNTATADTAETESQSDNANVALTRDAAFSIAKTVTSVTGGQNGAVDSVGDVINYSVVVTNTGNTTLTGLTVSDPLIPGLNCGGVTTLPPAPGPGNSVTCTGSYTVTQGDIDANGNPAASGQIQNTATADTAETESQSDSANVPVSQNALFTINKSVTGITGGVGGFVVAAGNVVNYSVIVTNTGNTTLTGVSVTDPLIGGTLTCNPSNGSTLLPGNTLDCSGSYTVTQQDLDNNGGGDGDIDNTATANASSGGISLTPIQDSATAPISQNPALSFTKSVASVVGGNGNIVDSAGDVINYELVVTNTGNVTLTGLSVIDPLTGAVNCGGVTTLPPAPDQNSSVTCTASYEVTLADLNNNGNPAMSGQIQNTATADTAQTEPVMDNAAVALAGNPAFEIAKVVTDVNGEGPAGRITVAGQTVSYEITVSNIGSVTLDNVNVSDPLIANLSCTPSIPATLAPNASVVCSGSYDATQNDIDTNGGGDGDIDNTATATAFAGQTELDPVQASAAARLAFEPASTIVKSVTNVGGDGPSGEANAEGDLIEYEIVVTNTGNVTLTGISVVDPLVTNLSCGGVTSLPPAPGPGNSVTCTGSYAVTQADLDDNGNPSGSGQIVNTASVTSTEVPEPQEDTARVTVSQAPAYTIVKTVTDVGGEGPDAVVDEEGDIITFQVVVENTGNVTLNPVSVSDPLVALNCASPLTALDAGQSVTCTGTYTVTQADIDDDGNPVGSGQVVNTATVSSEQLPDEEDTARVTISRAPSYTVAKSVTDVGGDGPDGEADEAGDVISYEVVVENTGNTTLTNVDVDDPLAPLSCTPVAPASLNPAETLTCTGSYTVTQDDIDNDGNPADSGQIVNTATVSSDELPEEEDTARVTVSQAPAYTIAKTVTDVAGQGPDGEADEVGDVISYEVVIENTGNTTLSNVNVEDPLAPLSCTPVLPAELEQGDTVTCSGSYTVTQEDIDNDGNPADSGQIVNTATVSSDELPEEEDTARVTVSQSPAYTITKTVTDVAGEGPTGEADEVGDVIAYEVVVENTGNTTLTNVNVDDPLAPLTCTPTVPASLDQGDTITCSGSYTVTQEDIDNGGNPANTGQVVNTATVSSDELPEEEDTARVTLSSTGAYTIRKSVTDVAGEGPAGVIREAGDVISYEIVVENTGNTTLTNVSVDDPLTPLTCTPTAPATLNPLESLSCSGSYTVLQSDLDNNGNPANSGEILNTASVSSDELPEEEDTASVPLQDPSIVIEALAEVCINDVPYIEYDIRTVGLSPGLPVALRFFSDGGNGSTNPMDYVTQVAELTDQAESGLVLWPGAAVDAQGVGTAWPGWEQLPDGTWVEVNDGLVPSLLLEFEVNPTAQQLVNYPPRTANCVPPQSSVPPTRPPYNPQPVPVDNPWALLVLLMAMLSIGAYSLRRS